MDTTENLENTYPQDTNATTKIYIDKMEMFIRKHLIKHAHTYCDWSIYDLENEKSRILKKTEYYRDVMYNYNVIKSSIHQYDNSNSINNMSILDDANNDAKNETNIEFTSRVFRDLEWLTRWINSYTDTFWNTQYAYQRDTNMYENILERISIIINIYIKICGKHKKEIPDILISPNQILDLFFYQEHITDNIHKAQQYALELLKNIETITYIVLNRTEEYEFDLRNYDYVFHNNVDIDLEFIDILLYRSRIAVV